MSSIQTLLKDQFNTAISAAFGSEYADVDPLIQAANPPHFGDYQANFALSLAKKMGKNPKQIAEQVVKQLESATFYDQIVISGPGFVNFSLANEFLQQQLQIITNDERLGVAKVSEPNPVIVEYGSPNIAKEMHVGHLRSTVIGDAIARILSFLDYQVIRQNHVGDWGTQFGMLIQYLIQNNIDLAEDHQISNANSLYKKAKILFDTDQDFANKSREQVVKLQSGDKAAMQLWQTLVTASEKHFDETYQKLDVLLDNNDIRGESFYNPMLADIVKELKNKSLAEESQDAIVMFLPDFIDRDNNPIPFIIRKSDGGYLYATTDLAAIKFRIQTLKAQRIIYVVDARQSLHFSMLFAAAKKAGWVNENIRLDHAAFGTILGADRKPFKTRSGESIQLSALLQEAEKRAATIVAEKAEKNMLTSAQQAQIAEVVGIGALKYADLSTDKIKDYVFDWDKMLSFEGNTAPYLQNAYVRICAIFRKGKINSDVLNQSSIVLTDEIEHALAIQLLTFSDTITIVADELIPHRLCNYLYQLAAGFHKFYEHCPVLTGDNDVIRNSRLLLCSLTAKTLKLGLYLLGIKTVEQM
jgi:arginyl-tRNA synthetase